MDTARQLVRWALPGWMMFLFLTGFVAVGTLFHGQSHPIFITLLENMKNLIIPLGVASIPLGFIVYQVYYWVYWYVPIPVPMFGRRKFIDPVDRGKEILSGVKDHIDFKEIFDNPLNVTPEHAFEKWGPIYYKSINVMQKYRQNWHLSESAWYLALSDDRYKNTIEFLEKRNQFLGDIYHSLGACYYALALAFFGYMLILGYVSLVEIRDFFVGYAGTALSFGVAVFIMAKSVTLRILSLAINAVAFYLVFKVFRGGRMASFDALLALKHDVITNVMLNKPIGKKQ